MKLRENRGLLHHPQVRVQVAKCPNTEKTPMGHRVKMWFLGHKEGFKGWLQMGRPPACM